jgi:hypothetical protein
VLVQAAHAAAHTQTYLGEQYRRIRARRGDKKAAMAVGHSILVIFYQMVKTGEPYHKKGADDFTNVNKEKIQQRLIRQLERLGNRVSAYGLIKDGELQTVKVKSATRIPLVALQQWIRDNTRAS